jgi:hypothetical protein
MYNTCPVQIDTSLGLCVALTFGALAYLDHKEESAREAGAELPQLWRGIGIGTVAIIAVILVGMSAYLFAHVPVVLWEVTAGIVLGSLTLRLLFRIV